jgi:hypothetical protein
VRLVPADHGVVGTLDDARVTHGICLPCAERLLEEYRRTRPDCAAAAELDSLLDWGKDTVACAS